MESASDPERSAAVTVRGLHHWFPLAACLCLAACGDDGLVPTSATAPATRTEAAPPPAEIVLGAFSAAREVLGSRLLPVFARRWQSERGQRLTFVETYTGSGDLTRSIAAGSGTDVAVFAMSHDVDQLAESGFVAKARRERKSVAVVCRSLVVLAVRKGNPKGIKDWCDLLRQDVRIVTADPSTSGGGIWGVAALYGAALRGYADVPAGDRAAALGFVNRVATNFAERLPSAGEAYRSFQAGNGDVAITYESELALGWMFGHEEERVIPSSTVLVECPAAIIDRNVDHHGVRAAAEGLLAFLLSTEGQKQIAFCGLRPVDVAVAAENADSFPCPADLWTIEDLGGWEHVVPEVLAPIETPAKPGPTDR